MELELFAHLLAYPTRSLTQHTTALIKLLENLSDVHYNKLWPAVDCLKEFYYYLERTNVREQEEIYIQTFEVQSITTLNTGYILFGDDYKRAELLVHLNNELNKYGIQTDGELADHLPNVLKLLTTMPDNDLKQDIITYIVYPAIKKMINDFDSKIIDKKHEVYLKHQKALIEKSKEFRDIYLNPLMALKITLEEIYQAQDILTEDKSKGFLSNIEQELNIEKI